MTDEHRPEPDPLDWPDLERGLRARPPRHDSGAAWAKLERAIDKSAPPADVRPLGVPSRRPLQVAPRFAAPNWAARIAAVLVIGGGIALAWRELRPAPGAVAPGAMREVVTGRGQRATVWLGDGTRVELGIDSRLRYAPEFGAGSRDVELEGEAYFDVVHDDRRPFAVHTARAEVRDLGTKFNVRSYADAPEVEVVVAEGAVALAPSKGGASHEPVLLYPGDLGRVEADGRLTARRGVDVGAHLAWIDGRLVFIDAPLREVLPRLARWYDVNIRLGDSTITERRYTASLKNETLPQLLDLMSRSMELRVERVADTIVLYGKSGIHSRPFQR